MSVKRRFKQVDVFTARPFLGNPVAVILDAEGLDTAEMQRIARWTNLSETTFVLPATTRAADYRLRIFTPGSELPFAGHPTVGSAHAVLEAGIVAPRGGRLVQECGAGLLDIDVTPGSPPVIFVTAPPAASTPLDPAAVHGVMQALQFAGSPLAPPASIRLGPTWLIVALPGADAVAALAPDMGALAAVSRSLNLTGVTVFGAHRDGPDAIAVRSFAPAEGVPEDPVCGSGNAAAGAYLAAHDTWRALHGGYSASQGHEIGRDGRVQVRFAGDRVRIGGTSVTCVDGLIET